MEKFVYWLKLAQRALFQVCLKDREVVKISRRNNDYKS